MAQSAFAQLPHRLVALLQAVERAPLNLKDRRELGERQAALAVDAIGVRQFGARATGPDDTDSGPGTVAESLPPRAHLVGGSRKVRRGSGYRVDARCERERQAEQGAVQVEVGQGVAPLYDPRRAGKRAQQRGQRRLHLDDNPRPALRHQRDVAAELERVAESLLGMQEDGLARDLMRSGPQRLREVAKGAGQLRDSPAPFVLAPAAREI